MRFVPAGLCLAAILALSHAASATAILDDIDGAALKPVEGIQIALTRKSKQTETPQAPGTTGDTAAPTGTTPTVPPAPSVTAVMPLSDANAAPKRTLGDCMKTWDKDTHMSKTEWKATCIRSMKEAEKHDRQAKAEAQKAMKKKQAR